MAAEHLTEQDVDMVAEAIYRGRLRQCEATIEGWEEHGRDSLLCRVLRGESERFAQDARQDIERIVSHRLSEQAEQIAQAIEHGRDLSRIGRQPFVSFGGDVGWLDDHIWAEAARIARAHREGQ